MSIIISLIIFALIVWLVFFIIGLLPLDARIKQIVTVVIAVICLIYILEMLFGGGGFAGPHLLSNRTW